MLCRRCKLDGGELASWTALCTRCSASEKSFPCSDAVDSGAAGRVGQSGAAGRVLETWEGAGEDTLGGVAGTRRRGTSVEVVFCAVDMGIAIPGAVGIAEAGGGIAGAVVIAAGAGTGAVATDLLCLLLATESPPLALVFGTCTQSQR